MPARMPYTVKVFQSTPNPNAVKCILDRRVTDRPRSYFKPEDASSDPLGARLFSIPGVTNILMNGDWMTVSKSPAADWKAVKQGVEQVLREAP
jgi:hypothetical protein